MLADSISLQLPVCVLAHTQRKFVTNFQVLSPCVCRGVINRYGFNSLGVDAVSQRLEVLRQQGLVGPSTPQAPRGLVGVNLGKNKTSEDAAADYSVGLTKLGQFADYVVINISSPNTPGTPADPLKSLWVSSGPTSLYA